MKWRSLQESAEVAEIRPLAQVLSERKNLIAKYVSAEIQAVNKRAIAEVRDSGIGGRALQSGDKAQNFELSDQNGALVRDSDLLRKSKLVVCFFRGRLCPFCVWQL